MQILIFVMNFFSCKCIVKIINIKASGHQSINSYLFICLFVVYVCKFHIFKSAFRITQEKVIKLSLSFACRKKWFYGKLCEILFCYWDMLLKKKQFSIEQIFILKCPPLADFLMTFFFFFLHSLEIPNH